MLSLLLLVSQLPSPWPAVFTVQSDGTNTVLHRVCTSFLGRKCVILLTVFVFVAEPKPVYAQPGQPDVDLPVSPSDAPVPSAAHDDSILR